MARGLAPVGARSGPLHFHSHTACAGLATAAQPNGGKPPHHRFASASDLGFASASAATIVIRIPNLRRVTSRGEGACPRWGAKRPPAFLQSHRMCRFGDCCAAERGQAPSPQVSASLRAGFASASCCHDSNQNPNFEESDIPWRGGLPPLGREAAPCIPTVTPHVQDCRLLRSRTGASPLATG